MLGLNKRILQVISGMLISFAPVSLSAQVKYANITFQSPDTTDPALKELSINILQQNILMVGPVNTELKVLAGVKMKIEFLSNLISIKGYTDIAIYSDTIIFLGAGDLQPITVRSKKRMVQQTLSGFVYNPQSDSLFRKGNILMALQRLPFFRLEVDAIKYKQGEKVLFMINGKEREGIANWNDVLRNIPAKEIYKVELITDIPLTVENRGYSAIVDLRTADVNLSGSAISAVLTADQRKNLNENIDATFLKNRSDYSIQFNHTEDNQRSFFESKSYVDDVLKNSQQMALKYKNQNFSAYAKIGIRLDSSRDFSAGLTGLSYKESNGFQNIINYPVPLNDQSQTTRLERITGNFSFLHRKTKLITKYAALSISTEERDLSIRSSFAAKQNYDSLREHSVTSPISIIFDYNANNKTKKNATREMGVQGYLRQTQQDYEAYNLKSTDNTDNQLLYARPDSFNLSQFSVSPYFKITRGFSQKSNLVIRSRTEVYHIKVNGKDLSTFLLPSLNLQQNFLKNNNSLSISTGINFFKPGLDILLPLQYNVNPAIKNLGNSSLNPSKNLYFGLQFDSYRKINMIHKLIFAYSYDVTRNYTTFDSVSQLLIKMPDDHNKVQSIAYSLDFEAVVFKKVNLFVTGTLTYAQYRNSIFKTHHSGWALSSSALLSYPLGEKLGTLGLSTYITGKEFNAQGSSVGSTNYSAYYAKTFFRNKIAVTFLANEFLAKYRDYSSTTFGDNSRQFVNYRRPYRLLSLRVAYRFSNIKVNKKAVEKRASIKDESSNR